MCLNGCSLKLQSIKKAAFLYAFNGNSFINSVWARLGFLLELFFFLIYLFWDINLSDYYKIARVINWNDLSELGITELPV